MEGSGSFDEYDNDYFRVEEASLKATLIEGDRLRQQGKTKAALKALQRATKEHPTEAQAWDELGQTYMILQRYADAYDAYTQALFYSPSFLVYGHRAECELKLGQYTPALHDYDMAIDLVCDDSRATNVIFNELKVGRKRAFKLAAQVWKESSASRSQSGSKSGSGSGESDSSS